MQQSRAYVEESLDDYTRLVHEVWMLAKVLERFEA